MSKYFTFILFCVFSVTAFSQASNWEWQNSKPTGNNLRSVAFTPDGALSLFGDGATYIKSTNMGVSWNLAVVDTGYRDILESYFFNSNVGIICGNSGLIMKTTDGGKRWNYIYSGVTTNLWYIDFVTADTGYIVGTGATILKTTDAGETWVNKSLSGTTAGIAKVHFVSPSTGYAGTANSTLGYLIKTTDYGNTWTKVASYPGTGTPFGICFTDVNNGYASDNTCTMYKTTDAGATWTSTGKLSSGTLYEIRFADANNGAVCGSKGEVFVTTNAGAVWTKTNNPYNTSLYALGMQLPSKRLVTCGNGGVISTSTDFGATWTMMSSSATVQLLKRIQFLNANVGYAVGGSALAADSLGQLLKTTNGGSTWNLLAFNSKTRSYSQFWMNENLGWVGGIGANGLFKTTDGGATFTAGTVLNLTASTTWYEIEFADGGNVGYSGGTGGILVKTTDGGATWNQLTSPTGTTIIYSLHVFDANKLIVVGGSGKGFMSTDGGGSWFALDFTTTASLYQVSFTNKDLGVIAGSSSTIMKTTDGGYTWIKLTPGVTATYYAAKFQDQNIGWACGTNGIIIYTTDGGATWSKCPLFMSTSTLYDIAINSGKVWIVNDAGSITKNFSDPSAIPVELTSFSAAVSGNSVKLSWKTATEVNNKGYFVERKSDNDSWVSVGFVNGKGNSTNISEYSFIDNPAVVGSYSYRLKQVDFDGTFDYSGVVNVNMTAPANFSLSQNYPNPFNPSTTIRYSVPQASKVSVKVYNVLGKEVASLVNETKQAGNYEVVFNASQLSSGIYFYKMQAGSFTDTKKLTLIK